MRQRRRNTVVANLMRGVGFLGGSWIAYSNVAINHKMPLPRAIQSDWGTFASPSSRMMLHYYCVRKADGRPLVLFHSINAAASSYEMRPIFEYYRAVRPVYALDLPSFGMSARLPRVYTPQLYAGSIIDFLATQVKEPADVVALSLSSEFAARAALQRPDLFHSLTMISPTGFSRRRRGTKERRGSEALRRLLTFPLWSRAFYDLLVTRPSIRYFLQMRFVGPVDEGLVDYDYLTSHQPGARHAPLYFVSSKLFTPNVREAVYARLMLPVLVIYDQDPFVRFDTLPEMLFRYNNWRVVRIAPTKGMPHFEKMAETAQALNEFWGEITRMRSQQSSEIS